MKLSDFLVMASVAAMWGSSFLFMRISVPETGPYVLVAGRIILAALVLLTLVVVKGQLRELCANIKHLSVLSLLYTGVPFVFFSVASEHVTAGMLSVLNATAPLWTLSIALLWLREKVTLFQVFGMLVGFSGVVLLIASQITGSVTTEQVTWHIFLPLISTACYGLGNNYTRKYLRHVSAVPMAAGSQLSSALILIPVAYFAWPETPLSGMAWFSICFLGLISSALSFILMFYLIGRIGVVKSSSITFMVPVFGALWGYLFLHEPITWVMIVSALLIFVGLVTTMQLPIFKRKT